MFAINCRRAAVAPRHSRAAPTWAGPIAEARHIALLQSGRRRGPVTRFITPWDIGELTQPFLFLDYVEFAPGWQALLAAHPQPGVATVTLVLSGKLGCVEAAGNRRIVTAGGFRWRTAGRYAGHERGIVVAEPLRVFQLWVRLPPGLASSGADCQYVAPCEVQKEGPVRVVLGQLGRARSTLEHVPADINCFHVRLRDGERWRYVAADRHNVTWLAIDRGGVRLRPGERVYWEQIALFGDSPGVIELQADGETSLLLGSATRLAPEGLRGNRELVDAAIAALVPAEVEMRKVVHDLRAPERR
jgi:redox-sensitive bicupin YhaK (pirin superfamily)